MNHSSARAIFEEIRNRPYAWLTAPGKQANNCYFKGIELLQRLGILSYAVRAQIGETFLDKKVPPEIQALYPANIPLTHFWVEAQIEGSWRILDPSFDPPLSKAGLLVTDWDSNRTCFEITKVYSQEETIAYQGEWAQPQYAERYFEAIAPCATALNKWFEAVRAGGKV